MMHPEVARDTWAAVEPVHSAVSGALEAAQCYGALGLDPTSAYFACRAAPLGAVPAEVVIATLFSFYPGLVRTAIPKAWQIAAPGAVLSARLEVADRALRRLLGDAVGSKEMVEAAGLARRAAEAACEHPEGRPLFAAHAALPWPDEAHLALWHAQTLLDEWRGDAHAAVLVAEGLTGLDALVTYAATGEEKIQFLRATHGWPDDQWQAAVEGLRGRGVLLADGDPVALALTDPVVLTLSETGRAQRHRIEERTDAAAVAAYGPLGEEGCARLHQLCRPWGLAITENGVPGETRLDHARVAI